MHEAYYKSLNYYKFSKYIAINDSEYYYFW